MDNARPVAPDRELLEMSRNLSDKGLDLRELWLESASKVLGTSTAQATLEHMGDSAFSNPRQFVDILVNTFDGAAKLLLSQLVETAALR